MIADECADKDEQSYQAQPPELYSSSMQLHSSASRYVRHHNYSITPLPQSESDEEDSYEQNTITFDSRVCITAEVEPLAAPTKKRIIRRLNSTSKLRKNKPTAIVDMIWDDSLRSQASPECRAVNFQIKRQIYQQIQSALGRCQFGKTRIIVVEGVPQTGKKTIIDSVLAMQSIENYYLDFSNSNLPLKKKVKQLHQFIVTLHSKKTLHGLSEQSALNEADRVKPTVIVINCYTSFLATLKRREECAEMKKLLRSSRSVVLIGVTCDVARKPCKLLADLTHIIKMPPNSKEYFLESLLAAVNSSPLLTHTWFLPRPLANFFSSKMEQTALLSLQTITRLLRFLDTQPRTESEPQRLTRDILLNFEETISRHSMRVDLERLSIHQKCVLVACFTELQESSAVLLEEKKLMKTYEWACCSLQITPKTKKEVKADLLYQLETYQLVRTYPSRTHPHSRDILLAIDLACIRAAYAQDFLLAKFFP